MKFCSRTMAFLSFSALLFSSGSCIAATILEFPSHLVNKSKEGATCESELGGEVVVLSAVRAEKPVDEVPLQASAPPQEFHYKYALMKDGEVGLQDLSHGKQHVPWLIDTLEGYREALTPDRRHRLKMLGLKRFNERIGKLALPGFFFRTGERYQYVRLLELCVKDVFLNNDQPEETLNKIIESFQNPNISNFTEQDRFEFLSAILSSIDIERALRINPAFKTLIAEWKHDHEEGIAFDFDQMILARLQKIN